MARLISYSQNFEDILLWRALKDVDEGLYIDIGAQDPDVDSVSRMFYEQGWRGIHVEAMASYAEQLRNARADELVIHAAVGSERGVATFYQMPDSGLSTVKRDIADSYAGSGRPIEQTAVAAITLDDVLDQVGERQVHWLKIDVEGAETDVLSGWRSSPVRPWLVVVESVLPMSQVPSHAEWEPTLLSKGYTFAHFDGLNRYYVAEGHEERVQTFASGPNLFDGISFSGTSSSTYFALIREQLGRAGAIAIDATEHASRHQARIEELEAALVSARGNLEREQHRGDDLSSQLKEVRAQLEKESATKQRELMEKVEDGHANLRSLRDQYDQLKSRFDVHVASEVHWKKVAGELDATLTQLRSSLSWRLTVPLRYVGRLMRAGLSVPRRTLRLARRAARSIVVALMRQVLRRPALRDVLARRMDRYPSVKDHLRALSISSGLTVGEPVHAWDNTKLKVDRLSRGGAQVLARIEHAQGKVIN